MKVKSFKFKVIRDSESIILSLNFSDLSIEIIRQLINNSIKVEANKECKLLFIGNIDCKLELEDIYNLASLIQSIVGKTLVWDIINDIPKNDEPEDLAGYLIIAPN